MTLTADLLKKCMPSTPLSETQLTVAAATLNAAMAHYKISTPRQQAMFLANLAHESGSMRYTSENLNYAAKDLRRVFPKYFPDDATAKAYERQPQKIANRVYANRMGNGNEASGDGWKRRGAGFFQTTGTINHTRAAKEFGKTIDEISDWLRTIPGACWSACFYWHDNALNKIADKPDMWRGDYSEKFKGLDPFKYICVYINGGINGLVDRQEHYARISKIIK